ncbi:alpha-1A adrenergic receptor-like [Penaeus japonicus]|uniref:alpha-1A adrenergic receptor-like n=1 Tax=Penaeus japonicus TaxID=27405 RepID=UPI001C70D50A|nr:alpha-1A adrenergic receptor-like [Penaeus japonicus]
MSVEITDPHWPNLTSTLETVASELTAEPEGDPPLDLTYAITEILVAVVAIIGNALTLTVFAVDRKLRRLTNYYIVALAVADLLVGVLGIPFAILTSIGLPKLLWPCLLMLSTLLVLCTTSIFCLVAVSVDRYWAILYPLRYSRVMTAKIARYIILMCWLAGTFIGLLPLMGWHGTYEGHCTFTVVMDYDYLVFLYFFTIVGPGIIMAVFYTHIYTVVLKQLRQIAAQEPQTESSSLSGQSSQKQRPRLYMSRSQSRQMGDNARLDSRRSSTTTNIVNQVTHANRREVKAAKSLSIIVLFFMVSWFPLYTINCVKAFCKNCNVPPFIMNVTIILSHLNSAINPLLYAYHMKDFRMAIKMFTLHRILRRPLPHDYIFNRSLVSPHHSTLYRVNVSGVAHNTNLHTPHAHNTPLTGSPSPLIGTPKGGQRSRTSTVGSCGPWPPSRGLSPSPSSPHFLAEPRSTAASGSADLLRPRAATITTHTAPASALKASSPTKSASPPAIQSGPTVTPTNSRRQVNTLPPDILMAATDRLAEKPSSPDAASVKSCNISVHVDAPKTTDDIKEHLDIDSETSPANRLVMEAKAEKSCVGEERQDVRDQVESPSRCEEIRNSKSLSESSQSKDSIQAQTSHEQLSGIITEQNADTKSEKDSEKGMNILKETELGPLGHDSPPLPNGSACSAQEETTCTNHQVDDPGLRREELISLFDSPAQCTRAQIREDLDPRPAGQKLGESRLSREFYKYIPKILRRTQGQLKSKSSKNTKSWWPELMKQRSYHDLPGVKSSEQVRRTWSACSAMDS